MLLLVLMGFFFSCFVKTGNKGTSLGKGEGLGVCVTNCTACIHAYPYVGAKQCGPHCKAATTGFPCETPDLLMRAAASICGIPTGLNGEGSAGSNLI